MIIPPRLLPSRPAVAGSSRLRCFVRDYPTLPAAAGGLSRWASPDVTYSAGFAVPGLSESKVTAIIDRAAATWASKCGLRPKRVDYRANIIPGAGPIDRAGGTLAYSYMPSNPSPMSDQLQQVYDTSEAWDEKFFFDVVLHEFGHAFGLEHADDPQSIMYPWANGKNTGLFDWEIQQMVARYGPSAAPVPTPTPPPTAPSPGDSIIDVSGIVLGVKYRLRLERWK